MDEKIKKTKMLSSAKREDFWAIIIACLIMFMAIMFPDALYTFFKKSLFLF